MSTLGVNIHGLPKAQHQIFLSRTHAESDKRLIFFFVGEAKMVRLVAVTCPCQHLLTPRTPLTKEELNSRKWTGPVPRMDNDTSLGAR